MGLGKEKARPIQKKISIDIPKENIKSLDLNSEVDDEIRLRVENLFTFEYINKQRPDAPRIKTELILRLKNERPIFWPSQTLLRRKRTFIKNIRLSVRKENYSNERLTVCFPNCIYKKKMSNGNSSLTIRS